MRSLRYLQMDVFADRPGAGNPLGAVLDGDRFDPARMQAFAAWTNLSETIFLLPPTQPGADYRVRIFTPCSELPFAGHPSVGAAWAVLDAGLAWIGPTPQAIARLGDKLPASVAQLLLRPGPTTNILNAAPIMEIEPTFHHRIMNPLRGCVGGIHRLLHLFGCEFGAGQRIPTSENLVLWIRDRLRGTLGGTLTLVRVDEDDDLAAEWTPTPG